MKKLFLYNYIAKPHPPRRKRRIGSFAGGRSPEKLLKGAALLLSTAKILPKNGVFNSQTKKGVR